MSPTSTIRREWHFLTALLLFVALSALLLPYFVYHLNPDAISYIDIAKAYQNGDWTNAVNAYWGPLYSWLLVPLLQLHIDPLIAEKLISIVAGVLLFFGLRFILKRVDSSNISNAAYWALLPFALFCVLSVSSPDLLLTALLTWYIALTLNGSLFKQNRVPLIAGLIGGIAYLTKSVALPFFILHFTAFLIIRTFLERPRFGRLVRQYLIGLIAFFVVAGPWVMLISQKEGHLTIGTAGSYIYASKGIHATDLPILTDGLAPPAFEGATSVWAEPTQMPITPWSMFESASGSVHQAKLVFINSFDLIRVYLSFSAVSILLILTALAIACGSLGKETAMRFFSISTIVSIAVLEFLYLPILVDARYFWLSVVLIIPIGTYALSRLFQSSFFTEARQFIFVVGFVATFTVLPFEQLVLAYNDGQTFRDEMIVLSEKLPLEGSAIAADSWKTGLFAAYHTHAKYFGMPRADEPLQDQLLEHDIEFYITWKEAPTLSRYREVAIPELPNIHVLRRVR